MRGIWCRFKNFLKRFYPLTIHRFNQKMEKETIPYLNHKIEIEIAEIKKLQGTLSTLENDLKGTLSTLEKNLKGTLSTLENDLIRSIPKAEPTIEFALAEHCDLNCAGCDHFSTLAQPELTDYEEASRDFARLSTLFNGHVKQIRLMGGEPLLHPELIKFLRMVRKNFPDGDISIVTNGIKLLTQPEEFWQTCRENKIVIRPTKYPIPLDFEEMEKQAAEHGVEFHYYNNAAVIKTSTGYEGPAKQYQEFSALFSGKRVHLLATWKTLYLSGCTNSATF